MSDRIMMFPLPYFQFLVSNPDCCRKFRRKFYILFKLDIYKSLLSWRKWIFCFFHINDRSLQSHDVSFPQFSVIVLLIDERNHFLSSASLSCLQMRETIVLRVENKRQKVSSLACSRERLSNGDLIRSLVKAHQIISERMTNDDPILKQEQEKSVFFEDRVRNWTTHKEVRYLKIHEWDKLHL